ncbi:pilus assembly protein PilM [Priestia flexa]|uniref:type IV pilus biogenesis protein PilM n=1 Tax=Priestia flexa TaxID=86664 RepID=UPI0020A0F86C|nr:pilus assembly protein PilM [Priestia flexa]MCP1190767.1 pilus assembly protein PilM [Priestia flexa]
MALRLPSMKSKIGNLIIKDHVIRYIEVKQASPVVISKQHERHLPHGLIQQGKIVDEESLLFILDECVRDWKIKKMKVRFIVPDNQVVIRQQQLPEHVKEEEIRTYLFMELGATIHLPFEEAIFDYVIHQKTEKQTEITLFAAREDTVVSYMELMKKAKLKPVVADLSSLSTYRLFFQADLVRSQAHYMVLQVDSFSMNASLFANHRPVFMRHMSVGEYCNGWTVEQEGDKTSLQLYGDKHEQIQAFYEAIQELERIVSFYQFSINKGEQLISKVFVTGDHPYIHELMEQMQEAVSIPFEVINHGMSRQELIDDVKPSFHLPLGLALKEVR